jgi:NAD(P)-dependent dehydrogenase (short-subunit alcohol dehydrogenase family)
MTTYFVTGATGFIGRRLVAALLERPECERVFALVRSQSVEKLPKHDRLTAVIGDLTAPIDGPEVDHVVHLGAVYDFTADSAAHTAANVEGTRMVADYAARVGARWLHHVSSTIVSGDHRGAFGEDDFDLGQRHETPYQATKFAAEKIVREQSVPWRVYRPSAVVGDSTTGEMDKLDGPYYFFSALAAIRRVPSWLPLLAPHLGATNMVPVDFVVAALDRLIHTDLEPGRTFHLTATGPQSLTEVYNAFAGPAHAPRIAATGPTWLSLPLPKSAGPVGAAVLAEFGVPTEVLPHLTMSARYESATTRAVTGLEPPPLADYAGALWRYWSEHLDPDRAGRGARLAGRRVLITGASSGIGRATALAVARRGAIPLLVARRGDELAKVAEEIRAEGGTAHCYPCDLTDGDAVDALIKQVLAEHEGVDMLVNNAGKSIRRSMLRSVDRLHDYERTMALNYFAPLRLILGLLPHMTERRFGHIVNISTMGVQTNTPRFSAYLGSKAALDAVSRAAGAETVADGVTFTSVRMPLVRTPMIESTKAYDRLPAATPERAAELVVRALADRPEEVNLRVGVAADLVRRIVPRTARAMAHLVYRVFPDEDTPSKPLASVAAGLTRLVLRGLR